MLSTLLVKVRRGTPFHIAYSLNGSASGIITWGMDS